MSRHSEWLRKTAEEIRKENHAGWGNACDWAADHVEKLETQVEQQAAEIAALREQVARMPVAMGYLDDYNALILRLNPDGTDVQVRPHSERHTHPIYSDPPADSGEEPSNADKAWDHFQSLLRPDDPAKEPPADSGEG